MRSMLLRGFYLMVLALALGACGLLTGQPDGAETGVPAETPAAQPTTEETTAPAAATDTPAPPIVVASPTTAAPTSEPTPQATSGPDQPVATPTASLFPVLFRPEDWHPNLGDIGVLLSDGSGFEQLTSYRFNADPLLSPDGQRIAYRSVPISITSLPEPGPRLFEGNYNIWVITTNGSQAWQLTSSELVRSIPSWAADSRHVVFSQGAGGDLVEVEVDTGSSRVIGQGIFEPKYRPGGAEIAYLTAEGGLNWIDSDGLSHEIVPAANLPPNTVVHDFDWFPDGRHVAYTLADMTEQVGGSTIGIKYAVWINSVDRTSQATIHFGGRNVDVSPDGRTLAVLTGSGFGDACLVDQSLALLELDDSLTGAEIIEVADLAGFPEAVPGGVFYPLAKAVWISPHQAAVHLSLTCADDRSAAGLYRIDTAGRQMVQIRPIVEGNAVVAGNTSETLARVSGIESVDQAIRIIMSNDLDARRELVRLTTAGCTTVDGLGGPPKCQSGQSEGTPVSYLPVLGPGEGQPVLPEDLGVAIGFTAGELYAAYRIGEPAIVDEFYPAGTYALLIGFEGGDPLTGIKVHLDEQGHIVRLDSLIEPLAAVLEREAIEILVPPPE